MERKTVLVTFPCPEELRRELEGRADFRFLFREEGWTREDYLAALEEAHIILGEPRNEEFVHCRNLELLHSPCAGVNYYVEGGCFPPSARLCCVSGAYGNVIAEHMLSLILAISRRIPEYRDQQHRGEWKWLFYDRQLEDARVLILGAGDIGTTLAGFLRPMVKEIVGMRRVKRECPDCFDAMISPEELDGELSRADIVACALPQTPLTVGLLDERRLGLMKDDAILVNAGRGSLIDQEALCRYLQAGKFYGVGLEVTSPEPLPKDHPLWHQPRLILTPHASGNTFAPDSPLVRKIWKAMLANVDRFARGEALVCQIDFSTGYRKL